MPIGVEWQDERGLTLARYEGPPLARDHLTRDPANPATVCLRFIDPYGDTIFNQWQLPTLIRELEALAATGPEEDAHVVRALLPFLRRAQSKVHTYIKFIGD
ncbi:MAG TPA: hypothetical protein VF830_02605 [Gemmatimonadales bacterium]